MTTSVLSRTGAPVINIRPAQVNRGSRTTTASDILDAFKAAYLMVTSVRQTGKVSRAEYARVCAIAKTL
jgi:hypothetical protein